MNPKKLKPVSLPPATSGLGTGMFWKKWIGKSGSIQVRKQMSTKWR